MASNSGFTTTTPSDTSQVALGDDEFRSVKSFMLNWWEDEHFALGGSSSSAGEHRLGSGRAYVGPASQLSSPTIGRFFWDTDNAQLYVAPSESSWSQVAGVAADSVNTFTKVQDLNGFSASTYVLRSYKSTDSEPSWRLQTDGKMEWGSGGGAPDANLYYAASNHLKTDDTFEASTISTPKLRVGTSSSIKSIRTAILVIPNGLSIGGASSEFTATTAISAATGDTLSYSIEGNPGNSIIPTPSRVEPANGIQFKLSNTSTGARSSSTATIHITLIRHS